MAESLGIINTLPNTRFPYNYGDCAFFRTRAIGNCDLFNSDKEQSDKKLLLDGIFDDTPDPYFQHLTERLGSFFGKIKQKIDAAPQKAEDAVVKLANRKWAFLINPNPQPKPQFIINFESLTPKMKKDVLELYEYAQKELKVPILVNDAARTPEQQKKVKGGARCSPHMQGLAVDIHIKGKTIEEAQPYLRKLAQHWGRNKENKWGGIFGDPWHFYKADKSQTPICLDKPNNNKKLTKN